MISPADEMELAEAVRDASGPFTVRGGGTRGVAGAGEVLSVAGLSGVTLYEPGASTLVVQAGTAVAEVEALLAAEGQRLAFEPMDYRALMGTEGEPTIGGVVAANVSGPRRVQVGACRDFMLGVRFVDGTGAVVKNGGRVMKNVTGYDLVKLMAGSFGTLGVLSEVAFKVLARPEAEATLYHVGKSSVNALCDLSAALGSPFDISGAAYVGAKKRTQVRIEGLAGSVEYRKGRLLADVLQGFEVAEGEASREMWREIRDVLPFAGRSGDVWRVSVKPLDGAVLSERLNEAGTHHEAIFDWGGGLVWLLLGVDDEDGAANIRDHVTSLGGHATLVRGSVEIRAKVLVFHPEPPVLAAISGGLRARFDPRGILNPGMMG